MPTASTPPPAATALFAAVENGHLDKARTILESTDVDVNRYVRCSGLSLLTRQGWPLDFGHTAPGYIRHIDWLHHPSPSLNSDGLSPLDVAVLSNNRSMTKMLLQHGAVESSQCK